MKNRTEQVHGIPGVGGAYGAAQRNKMGWLSSALGAIGGSLLGPVGPILGSIAGAGINFGLNRIESGIQNRYNAPKNVIKRLGQAGLPTAAYLQGGGNQSASSSQTYAQPDLGTAEAISREQVNRMQKQQFELMKREMALKEQELIYKQLLGNKTVEDIIRRQIENQYYGGFVPGQQYSNFGRMVESGTALRVTQQQLTDSKYYAQQLENNITGQLMYKGYQVKKYGKEIELLGERIQSEDAKQIVYSQQVQESISRIAKNMVSMEAMKTQMSVAEQTIALRDAEELVSKQLESDLIEGRGFSAWLGAVIKKLIK